MDTPNHNDFGSIISKMAIAIPLLIILFVLFLEFGQSNRNLGITQKAAEKKLESTPTVKPTRVPQPTGIPFSLKGPLVCDVIENKASASAYVKNSNVYARMTKEKKIEYVLINGDCMYRWEKQKYTGTKTCGMKEQMALFTFLSKFGSLDAKTIMDVVTRLGFLNSEQSKTIAQIKPVCRKEAIDDKKFEIPINISFKEVKLTPKPQ